MCNPAVDPRVSRQLRALVGALAAGEDLVRVRVKVRVVGRGFWGAGWGKG